MTVYVVQMFGQAESGDSFGGGLKAIIDLSEAWASGGTEVVFFTVLPFSFTQRHLSFAKCVYFKDRGFSGNPHIYTLISLLSRKRQLKTALQNLNVSNCKADDDIIISASLSSKLPGREKQVMEQDNGFHS